MYLKKQKTGFVSPRAVVRRNSQNGSNVLPFDNTVNQQIDLLNYCIENSLPLSAELAKIGKTYDSLIYEKNQRFHRSFAPYRTIDDFTEKKHGIPVVSFFSGAGGMDLGFEAAGFEHLALFEKNELFCSTMRHNRPSWLAKSADMSDVNGTIESLGKIITKSRKFEGVFVGGPPCQPFSIAANQRFSKNGNDFKRVGFAHETNGNLLFDFIEIILAFKPKVFLIENVPGLLDIDNGEQLSKAVGLMEASGYTVQQPLILRADSYSVPQQRLRLFLIGSRSNREYNPPKPEKTSMNVGSVFDLPIGKVKNHVTREHNAESVLRYMMLDYGQRDKLGRVDRLDPAHPSKTIIAGGTAGGGRSHLHPYIPRTLSVRESARIQTFPDDYEFLGPVARQFTQVGNAVPPILAAQLAHSIYKSYFG